MAGVAVLLLLLTACGTSSVEVQPTPVSGAARRACAALVADLPARVSDQTRRRTTGDALAAAWGDPAIVLRCGVGRPAGYTRFATCQRANGLDWFVPDDVAADQSKDVVMTTVGRVPAVEVVVPASDRPPVPAMVDLGPTIKSHTRLVRACS